MPIPRGVKRLACLFVKLEDYRVRKLIVLGRGAYGGQTFQGAWQYHALWLSYYPLVIFSYTAHVTPKGPIPDTLLTALFGGYIQKEGLKVKPPFQRP